MNRVASDAEVKQYLSEVRTHLSDLGTEEREELVEDLEDHLREVAAEEDGSLRERLGDPDAYAAELRASAGLPQRSRRPRLEALSARVARSRPYRAAAELWEGESIQPLRAFATELRPGWWLLRGWLAAMVLTAMQQGHLHRRDVPIPALGGSRLVGLASVVGLAWASVALGRRAGTGGTWRKMSIVASGAVLLSSFFVTQSVRYREVYAEPAWAYQDEHLRHRDGSEISNICPHASDGTPLSDVLLFDQSGRPIVNVPAPQEDNIYPRRSTALTEIDECPAIVVLPSPRPATGQAPTETVPPAAAEQPEVPQTEEGAPPG
ncbi:MAG TPA: hypothetical protein VM840_07855 [Actinomycetota bacterium]|nr:hypothetical protein [Actinomycetota bacterium]